VAGDRTFKVGLLIIFAGGPIVYGVQMEDGSLLLAYLLHKISKNGLEVRKLQPLQSSRGVVFTKNSQANSSYPFFEPLKKSLNIILSLLELKDDFVELKMVILKQFKLLNLNKNN
jgi:hypothetical protein